MSIGRVELKDLERARYDEFIADLEDGSLKLDTQYCGGDADIYPKLFTEYKRRVDELFINKLANDPELFSEFLFRLETIFPDKHATMYSVTNSIWKVMRAIGKLDNFSQEIIKYCNKKILQLDLPSADKETWHFISKTMHIYYDLEKLYFSETLKKD